MPEFRSRPEQYPVVGALGRYLQKADEFARKPFGYENPPAAIISDLLNIPPIYRTLENINYGTPITQGRGETYGFTADTKDALTGALDLAPIVPAAARMVKPLAKAAAPYAARHAVNLAEKYGVSPTMNVIKPKGGNWLKGWPTPSSDRGVLKGNAEEVLMPLRAHVRDPLYIEHVAQREAAGEMAPGIAQTTLDQNVRAQALNKWLDNKLAKYISNDMATAEDPLRLNIEDWSKKRDTLLAEKQKQIDKATSDMEKARSKRGFTPEMMTQSQARIRELNKEKTLIENRTGSYINKEELERGIGVRGDAMVGSRRVWAGYPEDETSKDILGKVWENIADTPLNVATAGDILKRHGSASAGYLNENPWLAKIPPETPTYSINDNAIQRLHLDHLKDELVNAMRPGTDLPEHLRIDPNKLEKMTVTQVADVVDQINAWRAVQTSEVNAVRANNIATVVHKEYPQGLKWVELKMPETQHDITDKLVQNEGGYAIFEPGEKLSWKDPHTGLVLFESPEEATKAYSRGLNYAALEDALKYEGEQLGHCVGGYCPSVEIGESRIFSLRDAEGKPRATIETRPQYSEFWSDLEKREKAKGMSEKDWLEISNGWNFAKGFESNKDSLRRYLENKGIDMPEEMPQRIHQIKGMNNRKPPKEMIPFIQDFVRSDKWKYVIDIENADMFEPNAAALSKFKPAAPDLADIGQARRLGAFNRAQEAGELNNFLTRDEWEDILRRHINSKDFAQGGSVNFATGGHAEYDDDLIRQMAAELVDAQQERAEESRDMPEASLLESLRNMSPLGGRVSAGPFDLDAMTHSGGVNLRGSVGTDNLRGYIDVDPRQKKLSQLGVTYEDMNPRGGYHLNASMDPETREKTLNAMYRKQLSDGSELMVGGTHRPDSRQTMLNLMYRYGFAQGGAVHMEKGGKAKRKEPSPFDGLEPTFGDRMGTWVSDKVTEGAINLYDKLAKRDRMSAAHKIYLDTFARDIRDPITAKDFNTEELSELQNLIRQKEKTLGGKGKGYIEYKDYTELTGGDRRKAYGANLIGGVLPPRPSLAKSLGQFNYELDPTTKQYKIIDEYDFNPQQIEYQGRKVDVPPEHYGDYISEMSPYALARLYGGRKMPPGTGRKVELSVPYAKGGEVEVGSSPLDQRLLELAYKLFRHDKYKSDKYPSNTDSVVSPNLPWDQKIVEMPGDFKFNTLKTDIGDEIRNNPFKPNDMDDMTKDWDEMGLRRLEKIKKRYYAKGGTVEFNPEEIDMMAAQLIEEQNG